MFCDSGKGIRLEEYGFRELEYYYLFEYALNIVNSIKRKAGVISNLANSSTSIICQSLLLIALAVTQASNNWYDFLAKKSQNGKADANKKDQESAT